MAAPLGYRFTKRPLDKWSMRERLALASSVKRSGDQNWVSVSRAIKPFGEGSRPPDWFSQKNCALQYADLLEKAETPKRKRGEKGEREVVETPVNQFVRKLTIERIEELKQLIQDEEQKYRKLKKEVEAIKAGRHDGHLDEMWNQILKEKQIAEEKKKEEAKKLEEEAAERAKALAKVLQDLLVNIQKCCQTAESPARKLLNAQRTSGSVSSVSEVDESTQDSIIDTVNVETTDDEMLTSVTISVDIPTSQSTEAPKHVPPTSPLLSYMLQSKQTSVGSLHKIKAEVEAEHALKQNQAANQKQDVKQEVLQVKKETQNVAATVPAVSAPDTSEPKADVTDSLEVPEVKTEIDVVSEEQVMEIDPGMDKDEIIVVGEIPVEEEVEVSTHESPVKPKLTVKTEPVTIVTEEPDVVELPVPAAPLVTVVEEKPIIKEEPPSPASSVSSRISESGSKTSGRKSKGGRGSSGARRGGTRVTRRSVAGDDQSSRASDKASDGETSDDDSSVVVPALGTSALPESIPNSPLSHGSDTEDDKAYKTWKKSIMLVWRAAANHKYANVFLHPVTDDIAPGYSSVVRRPKDLTIIKRHIENGTIRTTGEFQRDMMLMFTNAVMYNNSDHDVYKMAEEMYNDVMEHIEQYVNTQIMVNNGDAKLLRASRRNESSDKEEESRRRRTSSEAEGGKSKKRKARGDDP